MKLPTQSKPVERTTYNSNAAGSGAEATGFWSSLSKSALNIAKKVAPSLLGKR
ncbi:hypothetical protein JK628_19330 [Shewanella sp. KX20019]|uniref:hypothetical protein n=1 Tax=Shewanella sp. KX20019 TaxID=2803864 RepID=UPI001925832D|nr:hypothetical protein [Shewanella sp. KX20019]QQX79643.1 hypothetical protein JK628_19330 [Shewanella sp. KX20019]